MRTFAEESANIQLRAELKRRGWTWCELAKATGYTPGTAANLISGCATSERSWRRVEAAMRLPFMTDPAVFAGRLPMILFYGKDLDTVGVQELKRLWRKVSGHRNRPKRTGPALAANLPQATLRQLLEDHFHAARAAGKTIPKAKSKLSASNK